MTECPHRPGTAHAVQRVFQPRRRGSGPGRSSSTCPTSSLPDNPDWAAAPRAWPPTGPACWRRRARRSGLERVTLAWYRNAGGNNADLPATVPSGRRRTGSLPDPPTSSPGRAAAPFADLFATHTMVLAPTELSATAPLKVAARGGGFRAATMPGFLPCDDPGPAAGLRRDQPPREPAEGAAATRPSARRGHFEADGPRHELVLDLRHRTRPRLGRALPRQRRRRQPALRRGLHRALRGRDAPATPALTAGELPVQIDDEVVGATRSPATGPSRCASEGPESERRARALPPRAGLRQPGRAGSGRARRFRPASPPAASCWTRSWACTSPSAAATTSAARSDPAISPRRRRSSTSTASTSRRPSPGCGYARFASRGRKRTGRSWWTGTSPGCSSSGPRRPFGRSVRLCRQDCVQSRAARPPGL